MNPFAPHHTALLEALEAAALAARIPVYIIGGVVRDLLRGGPVGEKDFDFMVVGDAATFAARCVEFTGGAVKEFPDFLTAKIVAPEKVAGLAEIDFASSRSEIYPRPGSLPIVSPGDLAADLARRDFTINALALPVGAVRRWLESGAHDRGALRKIVVDRFEGLADLEKRCVRVLHPRSFLDDPTRIFRGCRYVVRLGGAFETETEVALRQALSHGALGTISGFRIVTELKKISRESDFATIFELLDAVGVLSALGIGTSALHEGLRRLHRLQLSPEGRFEVVARVLFAASGADGGEVFTRLGFGKRQIRHLEVDTTADRAALDGNHVSIPGLWYAAIRGVAEEQAVRAMITARGVVA